VSILLLYKRVFTVPDGKVTLFITAGFYGLTILYLVLCILSLAFCAQNKYVGERNLCYKRGPQVTIAMAAVNVSTDAYLFAIPSFIVAKLRVDWMTKLGVAAVFLIGVL